MPTAVDSAMRSAIKDGSNPQTGLITTPRPRTSPFDSLVIAPSEYQGENPLGDDNTSISRRRHRQPTLMGLTHDLAALLSIAVESWASNVHDYYRSSLSRVGLYEHIPWKPIERPRRDGETLRGQAVVVVGAGELTGQSLALQLARSGYTVFALVALPYHHTPPTSIALSSLLLIWSQMARRLKKRFPDHPGTIIPVVTDPELAEDWALPPEALYAPGGLHHANETIRAYITERSLTLSAVICAARGLRRDVGIEDVGARPKMLPAPPAIKAMVAKGKDAQRTPSASDPGSPASTSSVMSLPPVPGTVSLALTDESTLVSLYRANIVEPITLIKGLRDLLGVEEGSTAERGKVLFVNGDAGRGVPEIFEKSVAGSRAEGITQIIGNARLEAAKMLRKELYASGIDVCEVVVGKISVNIPGTPGHGRQDSDDSTASEAERRKAIDEQLSRVHQAARQSSHEEAPSGIIASNLAVVEKVFAVDDALLYSAVRRAIADRYPRFRHHAGLPAFAVTLTEVTPGGSYVRSIANWFLGKILPKSSPHPGA